VSGRGSGYHRCLNTSRHSCDNKVLIARKRVETKVLEKLNEDVLEPELLALAYEHPAHIKEHIAHVPGAHVGSFRGNPRGSRSRKPTWVARWKEIDHSCTERQGRAVQRGR